MQTCGCVTRLFQEEVTCTECFREFDNVDALFRHEQLDHHDFDKSTDSSTGSEGSGRTVATGSTVRTDTSGPDVVVEDSSEESELPKVSSVSSFSSGDLAVNLSSNSEVIGAPVLGHYN